MPIFSAAGGTTQLLKMMFWGTNQRQGDAEHQLLDLAIGQDCARLAHRAVRLKQKVSARKISSTRSKRESWLRSLSESEVLMAVSQVTRTTCLSHKFTPLHLEGLWPRHLSNLEIRLSRQSLFNCLVIRLRPIRGYFNMGLCFVMVFVGFLNVRFLPESRQLVHVLLL